MMCWRTAVRESGRGAAIVEKALSLVKPGGSQFLQTLLDEGATLPRDALCEKRGAAVAAHLHDTACGFDARYWKTVKA